MSNLMIDNNGPVSDHAISDNVIADKATADKIMPGTIDNEANRALRLIWIDLEMTGLNPNQHRIIEIASLVTDGDLNVLAEGPVIAIHQSEQQLAAMDEWNTRTHGASGLTDRVKASSFSERDAELATLAFLRHWVPAGVSPICGNSIGQDRRFLFNYMPELERHFHYRYLDVSTLKELVRRWRPELLPHVEKHSRHQAMDDIRESLAELRFYRQHFIRD